MERMVLMVMKVMFGAGFKGEGSRLKSKVEWTNCKKSERRRRGKLTNVGGRRGLIELGG